MEAKLVVVGGKANKAEVKLKLPTVVGRGRDADLTVAHGTVSRHHCMIYELDGALVVRDNGSLNGTLVEGQRIKESLLRPGDTLTIGPLTFRADYEHHGAYPSLSEQPTVPNFQDTVGDAAKSNGAPAPAEPPTLSNEEAGKFDFLNDAAAPAAEEEAVDLPDFGAPPARQQESNDEAAEPDDREAISDDGPTVDFAAGGSDVAPVSDDDAPSFGFLDQRTAEPAGDAPAFQAAETEPEATAAAEGEAHAEPEAAPSGAFDFFNATGAPAAEEEPQPEAAAEEDAQLATSENEPEEPASDAGEGSAPSFGFLNQEAAEPAVDEAPSLDLSESEPEAETHAEPEAEAEPEAQAAGDFNFLNAVSEPDVEEQLPAAAAEEASENAAPEAAEQEPVAEEPDARVAEAAAPQFDFLNQAAADVNSEAEAPSINLGEGESEPEAAAEQEAAAKPAPEANAEAAAPVDDSSILGATSEPAEEEEEPADVADEAGPGFDFLNQSAEAAVPEADAPSISLDGTESEPEAVAEPAPETAAEPVDEFSFLDAASEPADNEEPMVAAADAEPQFPASQADEEEGDEGPSFGHLGSMASAGEDDEPESSRLEITLHDPEESEAEAAGLADGPDFSSDDESPLSFDDAEAAPAESAGGFEFLKSGGEPELGEFTAPVDEDDASEPEALADEDSGEFALPVEEAAAEESGQGFDFLNERASDEAAEEQADDDEPGFYAISAEPPERAGPPSASQFAPASDEAHEEEAAEEDFPLEAEAMAPVEDDEAEDSVAEPSEKASKKRGWWPFGKSKSGEPAQAKAKSKGKAIDKPSAAPRAAESPSADQVKFGPTPPADSEEAAMEFLSDTPSPSSSDSSPDFPMANKDSDAAIDAGQPAKKGAGGDDDKLNDFFNSIGLD